MRAEEAARASLQPAFFLAPLRVLCAFARNAAPRLDLAKALRSCQGATKSYTTPRWRERSSHSAYALGRPVRRDPIRQSLGACTERGFHRTGMAKAKQ